MGFQGMRKKDEKEEHGYESEEQLQLKNKKVILVS